MAKREKTKGGASRANRRPRPYPYECQFKMVRLHLEEGDSTTVLREQFDVCGHSVMPWVTEYWKQDGEGSKPKILSGSQLRVSKAVKIRIVVLKESHLEYCPRCISDVLQRFFLAPANATSVH